MTTPRPLRVSVIGGGPVGLATAATLHHLLPGTAITVHDTRWQTTPANGTTWRDASTGVNRREQVVTLQSLVLSRLPPPLLAALLPPPVHPVWPLGPESPAALGYPLNARIRDLEDRLLAHAHSLGITLTPGRVAPSQIALSDTDLVVIADGPRSATRNHFPAFGAASQAPYSTPSTHVEDTVLGLRVTSHLREADAVALTVAQNRYLLNAIAGDGYLYMRLTRHEAAEVRGRTARGKTFVDCIQSQPCTMQRDTRTGALVCPTHGTRFVPAEDRNSLLWPRVQQGLRLFHADLHAVTVFRLAMESRPRFSAELTPTGSPAPVFGALVGDAANAIHFWPGRGLNHGLSSAVALARCVATRWTGRGLRSADFTTFEAAMAALQHRHKDRAWRNMVQLRDGEVRPVADIIADAIDESDSMEKQALIETVMKRTQDIVRRLDGRMPMAPSVQAIRDRVEKADLETLAVLAEAGPWETRLSGGPEVDLDALVPPVVGKEDDKKESTTASVGSAVTAMSVTSVPEQREDFGRDVLSDASILATFKHALNFTTTNSLAWVEARREIRALLVRADMEGKASDEEILDAIEAVDQQDDGTPDRVDADEFVEAVRMLLRPKERQRECPSEDESTDRLDATCLEKFDIAADERGLIEARQAARIVASVAADAEIPTAELAADRGRLRGLFEERAGRSLVGRDVFLEVVEMVLLGNVRGEKVEKAAKKGRRVIRIRRKQRGREDPSRRG